MPQSTSEVISPAQDKNISWAQAFIDVSFSKKLKQYTESGPMLATEPFVIF